VQLSECSTGIAVGVNLMLVPGLTFGCAGAGMLATTAGGCKTFDERGDGYGRSEACSAALLCEAIEGARAIFCVGGAVQSDGKSASLTAPNGAAQEQLMHWAMATAAMSTGELSTLEAHGTGTGLGDPIEINAFASAVFDAEPESAISITSIKANVGHAEPAAGIGGLVKLLLAVSAKQATPNAQLRVLNHLLSPALQGTMAYLPSGLAQCHGDMSRPVVGSVGSYGVGGTIARTVVKSMGYGGLMYAPLMLTSEGAQTENRFKRRDFSWEPNCPFQHRFIQNRLPSSDSSVTFRSPGRGPLLAVVADHVVQGRVIFPGAGYLEFARSAVTAAGAGNALRGVYFLQPLAVEQPGLWVEAFVNEGSFELRSSTDDFLDDVNLHTPGKAATDTVWHETDYGAESACLCAHAADMGALYDGYDMAGLNYGPQYRTLIQAWGGDEQAVGKLRTRQQSQQQSTAVHPADLDDALCASALPSSQTKGDNETRLPFNVEAALLQSASGSLWAVRTPQIYPPYCTHAAHCLFPVCVCRLCRNQDRTRSLCAWVASL
jgi:acyl transferase domain-containing protein